MSVREFIESNKMLVNTRNVKGRAPVALEYVMYGESDGDEIEQVVIDSNDEGILSKKLKNWHMVLDPMTFDGIRVYVVME